MKNIFEHGEQETEMLSIIKDYYFKNTDSIKSGMFQSYKLLVIQNINALSCT